MFWNEEVKMFAQQADRLWYGHRSYPASWQTLIRSTELRNSPLKAKHLQAWENGQRSTERTNTYCAPLSVVGFDKKTSREPSLKLFAMLKILLILKLSRAHRSFSFKHRKSGDKNPATIHQYMSFIRRAHERKHGPQNHTQKQINSDFGWQFSQSSVTH